MIGDLCKPMNPGESRTVRLTLVVGEAERLNTQIQKLCAGGPMGEAVADLLSILEREVARDKALKG